MAPKNEFRRVCVFTDQAALQFCLMRLPGLIVIAERLSEAWATLEMGHMNQKILNELYTRNAEPYREQFYHKNLNGQSAAMKKLLEPQVSKLWTLFENSLTKFRDQFQQQTFHLVYEINLDIDMIEFNEAGKPFFPESVNNRIRESYQFYLETPDELEVWNRCQSILENLNDLKSYMNETGFDLESPRCPIIGVNGFISEVNHNDFFINGAVLPTFRRLQNARLKAIEI